MEFLNIKTTILRSSQSFDSAHLKIFQKYSELLKISLFMKFGAWILYIDKIYACICIFFKTLLTFDWFLISGIIKRSPNGKSMTNDINRRLSHEFSQIAVCSCITQTSFWIVFQMSDCRNWRIVELKGIGQLDLYSGKSCFIRSLPRGFHAL